MLVSEFAPTENNQTLNPRIRHLKTSLALINADSHGRLNSVYRYVFCPGFWNILAVGQWGPLWFLQGGVTTLFTGKASAQRCAIRKYVFCFRKEKSSFQRQSCFKALVENISLHISADWE